MMALDPTTFAIISNGLSTIAQEMGERLLRSAYSTIIREARDCSTSLLDTRGGIVAQAQWCPIHMNSFSRVFQSFAARHDLSTLGAHEALLTNDPYSGGQHLNDFVLFTPIFLRGELLGYSASIGHQIDVGGGAAGPNATATDVFQEGLRLPLLRIDLERDLGDGMLEQLIRSNVRAPDLVMGDVYAQVAANRTGQVRLAELAERFGPDRVLAAGDQLQDYSERLTRAAIERLPDGVYAGEDYVDDNGFDEAPLRVKATVEVAGDELRVDLEGSSPQTRGIVNSPMTSTVSAVYGALALLLGGGDIPVNEGLFRPIGVSVPYGSFLNPSRLVAVRARMSACNRVYNAVMRAMASVMPERVITSGHDTLTAVGLGHMGEDSYRVSMEVVGGGWGACEPADGADVVDCPLSNCSNVPVEALEREYPFVRIEEYGLRRGSGGAGKKRGGLGARRVYRILDNDVSFNCYSDRFTIPPWGAFGGSPGAEARFTVERNGEAIAIPSKANFSLEQGDRLVVETAGGGGYGDPKDRDRSAVLQDLSWGYINEREAHEIYGLAPNAAAVADERPHDRAVHVTADKADRLTRGDGSA